MKTAVLLVALLGGCVPAELHNQSEATALAWRALGARGAPPSAVVWYPAPCLPDAPGCMVGEYSDAPFEHLRLVWHGFYSKTALAHELLHAALARRGDADPDHLRPEWGDPASSAWPNGGLVAEANLRLRASSYDLTMEVSDAR